MHITDGIAIEDIPQECIGDCSGSGDVTESVRYWRGKLELIVVDRQRAIQCLREYGAWEAEELAEADDETLAERVLWLACCDFAEFQTYVGRGYAPGGVPAGSSYFYLGI